MSQPFTEHVREIVFGSRLYDLVLGRRVPRSLATVTAMSPATAMACDLADLKLPAAPGEINPRDPSFRWLANAPDSKGAWAAMDAWMQANKRWRADAWRGDILGERLIHWIGVFGELSPHLPTAERDQWAAEIDRAARHAWRVSLHGIPPWRRFLLHVGRVSAALAMPGNESRLASALSALGQDVDRQVAGDGGHVSRAPSVSLAILALLIDVRAMLAARGHEAPSGLISAIDRSVPFIKALCHGDGGFALFNGATAGYPDLILAIVEASGCRGRAMTAAPHTGYHRLRAGQTTIIVDSGSNDGVKSPYHSVASFEVSIGRVRLLGNCGTRLATESKKSPWPTALASSAAQSTLIIADKDSDPAAEARTERRDHEGARFIEISHQGYRAAFGIEHRRAIYLNADGSDIRGEDTLAGGSSKPLSVRFHLHPDVRASMVAGGGEVIVKPPRGRGWRFISHHPVMLEESVSFFDGRQHRAQQIVILGNHEPATTTVKWRFAME